MSVNVTDFSSNEHQMTLAGRFLVGAQTFNQVFTPLLCIFGTLGNCVSVTVFYRTPTHRGLSASYYLSALAISDTGFLFNLGAVWLEDMGVRGAITSPITCPLVMYLGQVACFLSVWFIVAFTMERYFAVCHPLTRPTICTVARAKKVIGVLTLVALVVFSYVWIIAVVVNYPLDSSGNIKSQPETSDAPILLDSQVDSLQPYNLSNPTEFHTPMTTSTSSAPTGRTEATEENVTGDGNNSSSSTEFVQFCSVGPEHVNFSRIANHIDSIFTLLIPFGIISFLNVRIALCVWRLKDQRENMVAMAKLNSLNSTSASGSTTTLHQVGFVYRSNSVGSRHQMQASDQELTPIKSSSNRQLLSPNVGGGNSHSTASYLHLKDGTFTRESRTNLTVEFEPSDCSTSSGVGRARCCSQFNTKPIHYRSNGRASKSISANGLRRAAASVGHNAAETRVTKTLLLVSTVFLVLNLPSHAVRAATYMQSFLEVSQEPLFAAQQWANILFNMNFSVNFLLYCVSGKNFRMSVKNIFCSSLPFKLGKRKGPRILKPRRSCSPNPRLSPSLDSRHGDMYYPVSVTEVETYA